MLSIEKEMLTNFNFKGFINDFVRKKCENNNF